MNFPQRPPRMHKFPTCSCHIYTILVEEDVDGVRTETVGSLGTDIMLRMVPPSWFERHPLAGTTHSTARDALRRARPHTGHSMELDRVKLRVKPVRYSEAEPHTHVLQALTTPWDAPMSGMSDVAIYRPEDGRGYKPLRLQYVNVVEVMYSRDKPMLEVYIAMLDGQPLGAVLHALRTEGSALTP